MTPGARYQAAIDIANDVFVAPGNKPPALDRAIKAYFRERRYAGSKDRRFVRDLVWDLCRQRGLLMGLTDQDWGNNVNARLLVAALIVRDEGQDALEAVFTDAPHHPKPLDTAEKAVLSAMDGIEPPDWAWTNLPAWLDDILSKHLGNQYAAFLAAMDGRADLVLRVNGQRASRDAVQATLSDSLDIGVGQTAWAAQGLVLPAGTDMSAHALYKDGLVDIQDEAAQLACQYIGLQAGQTVLDYCAGGGGKSLALADMVPDHGGIDAFDVNRRRMRDIEQRAARAQAPGITCLAEKPDGSVLYDLVVVDAPCSGSGVWRRHPDDRWRWSVKDLDRFAAMQTEILDDVGKLVKPGGVIAYMTCSVLPKENQQQVSRFLRSHRQFSQEDIKAPEALLHRGQMILRPDLQQCDGFFMALLRHSG